MLRLPLLLPALLLSLASPSSALLLDFYEGLEHGAVAVDGFADFGAYSVTVTNPNRSFDLGVTFDSDQNDSTDADIEYGWNKGWSGGNLAPPNPDVPSHEGIGRLGDVLILQENSNGCDTGICSDPDDEGGYPVAGSFRFDLDTLFDAFAIDLIDLGDHDDEEGSISFFNGDQLVSEFRIDQLPSLLPDQNIEFGNDTANHIELSDALIGGAFDGILIDIQGSGAIDNIRVESTIPVPEPATAALLGLGLSGLAVRRRRRR
jgi:hypothetical protein